MSKPPGFRIGFDKRDVPRLFEMWQDIIDTEEWSIQEGGKYVTRFEELWSVWNGLPAVAFCSWSAAAEAALTYFGLHDKTVLVPSNTFAATVQAVLHVGGRVGFVDCNRYDLCMSYHDLLRKVEQHGPAAVFLVHIGGHIAFQVEEIARLCREEGIVLLEDCAHAHGAEWNGRRPGTWGGVGLYSFHATKTISTGEGGMLVSWNPALIEFARRYRNYGKPYYALRGAMNYRMHEFTAALGCVQVERMEQIVRGKALLASYLDDAFDAGSRVVFPPGMHSGYYKYVVFREIAESSGKVYDQPCHRLFGTDDFLPNTDWVARNHWCVPLYYRGGEDTTEYGHGLITAVDACDDGGEQ